MDGHDRGDASDTERLRSQLERARHALSAARPTPPSLVTATLTRLLEISGAMNRIHDRDELLCYLRDRLQELFDAKNSAVILFEDGEPRVLTAPGEEPREISQTVLSRVRELRAPFLVTDTTQDDHLRDRSSVRRLQLGAVLCAPLEVDGVIIGAIQFDHPGHPSPFTEDNLATLELFAHQASTALRNVTTLEHLSTTLARLREAQSQLVASERLRAVGTMAAAIGHDFNNLLTSLLGISELLDDTPNLPLEARKDIATIQTITRTGAEVVARLQRFAGRDDENAVPEQLDIKAIVDDVTAMSRYRFHKSEIHHLHTNGSEVEPVMGNSAELRELLLNLVLNALEATPKGGNIRVDYFQRGQTVHLEVSDDGPGIDSAVGDRVFEPFFTTKETGHGLGLSICWGIVARMDGELTFRRGDLGGCVFSVELPAINADSASPSDSGAAVHQLHPARVLVVDDEPIVREVLTRIVGRAGHEVSDACSGQEAIDLIENGSFDLIVSDLSMPRMSGIELMKELRRRGKQCPVVLMTGWSRDLDIQDALSEGISAVVRKPISARELGKVIAQTLSSA